MPKTAMEKQEALMRRLGELLSHDLGYIWGERESGPNGEKKEFLDKGKRFLTQLGKDLGFTEMKVFKNPGGIAVSGEVTLMGMWSEDNGLYVQLSEPALSDWSVLYRQTRHLKDFAGGNQFMSNDRLQNGDYAAFMRTLLSQDQRGTEVRYGKAA